MIERERKQQQSTVYVGETVDKMIISNALLQSILAEVTDKKKYRWNKPRRR